MLYSLIIISKGWPENVGVLLDTDDQIGAELNWWEDLSISGLGNLGRRKQYFSECGLLTMAAQAPEFLSQDTKSDSLVREGTGNQLSVQQIPQVVLMFRACGKLLTWNEVIQALAH